MLVCVPQMLELLRDYIVQAVPEASAPARRGKWYWKWWQYRRVHRRFGWKFWSFVVGAAPLDPALEEFWGKLGLRRDPGLRTHGNRAGRHTQPSVRFAQRTVGKAIEESRSASRPMAKCSCAAKISRRDISAKAGIRDPEGWLHTGDIGELDSDKRLKILGRKKEMIVSPDGLNVFPEDVERVLNAIGGVVRIGGGGGKAGRARTGACGAGARSGRDAEAVVNQANGKLEPHQRIRGFSVWPQPSLPRTSGTNKLKRDEIALNLAARCRRFLHR